MSPMAVSVIVLACVFGGALLGMVLRACLPERHRNAETKELVTMGMGLIATMAALVLGLLIASTQSSFDAQNGDLAKMASDVVVLDRILAHYGPESKEARELLRESLDSQIKRIWIEENAPQGQVVVKAHAEDFYDKILQLSPQTNGQRTLHAEALKIGLELGRTRWLLFAQTGSSIPTPFLVVLVFWLTILFVSFSLFAPSNPTVIATLLVCALSVTGAIFLILELDQPFSGLIQISNDSLRDALAQLGQ